METKGPSTEAATLIIVIEFKYTQFIKSSSKEAVDECINNTKEKLEKVEEIPSWYTWNYNISD